MAIIQVATHGGPATPFQLLGKNPIEKEPLDERLWEAAEAHLGFYGFLRVANARITRKTMLGLMDLPDQLWRDAYDDGVHPSEMADEVLYEEGFRE